MLRLAHIINPFVVDRQSDLFLAQPITFETIIRAKKFVREEISVELCSAQYLEDRGIIPPDFAKTEDLNRSVGDVAYFSKERKLPLLNDILERLYSTTDAQYLIYTNLDIALQPYFYLTVANYLREGYDALVINRRTIPAIYQHNSQIPQMWAEFGQPHPGWDCFIFPREDFPRFKLGKVCIGAWRVGLALLANMMTCADNFKLLENAHLTFHLGDDRIWSHSDNREYEEHNTYQVMQILQELEQENGPFSPSSIPGSFLRRKRYLGPFYDFWARNIRLPSSFSRFLNQLVRS